MPSPVRRCVLGNEDASGLIGPNRDGMGSVDGSYESGKKVCRKRASTVVDSGGEIASNAVRSDYAKLKGCLRISRWQSPPDPCDNWFDLATTAAPTVSSDLVLESLP
jgi:hypothetical protein